MFSPPRFVVVDDSPQHARAIAAGIQELGSACATVIYSVEEDVPAEPFAGARVIFMDLQLLDRSLGDFARHYAEIQRILSAVINPSGGPFLLVLWTDAPDKATELEEYLQANLFTSAPHTRPIALLPLSKADYIDGSGNPTDALALRTKISESVGGYPAMAALLQWEFDVLASTSGVLGSLLSAATNDTGEADLSTLLKRVATEAVGGKHVAADPKMAVHQALLPLLQDRLQHGVGTAEASATWGHSFDGALDPLPELSRANAAGLNSHIHLQVSGEFTTTDWGTISALPRTFAWRDFGMKSAAAFVDDVLKKAVATKWDQVESDVASTAKPGRTVRLGQIRIGAACDFAQKKDGPVPFAIVAFVPVRVDSPSKSVELMSSSHAWLSPLMDLPEWGQGHLFVDPRFVASRGARQLARLSPLVRIREQLLLQLISSISHYSARPGITRFIGKEV